VQIMKTKQNSGFW